MHRFISFLMFFSASSCQVFHHAKQANWHPDDSFETSEAEADFNIEEEPPFEIRGVKLANPNHRHIVRRGQTLSSIARKYLISISALRKSNKIRGSHLSIGQELIIPSLSTESTSPKIEVTDIWHDDLAKTLVEESETYGTKRNRKGSCLRGVRIALTRSLAKLGHIAASERLRLGRSAHIFRNWAINNASALCSELNLVPVVGTETSRPVIPGLIYVYSRGRCGYNRRYGHIEVVVDTKPTKVCSDHCAIKRERRCKPDIILAPAKFCPTKDHQSVVSLTP